MPQRCFSYVIWTFRLFAIIAALLQPGKGVAQSALILLTEPTGTTTCGASDGTIFASATGGSGTYEFILDGTTFSATGFFTNLAAGEYTVTVVDEITGASTSNVVIVSSGCLTVFTAPRTATCGNANGSVTVTVSGGTNYIYAIDTITYTGGIFQYQSTNVFNNVAGGWYTVVVMDLAGDIATASFQIGDIQGPTISTTVGPASCLNDDGTVMVNTSGGTAPFFYALNGGSFGNQSQFTGVASGPQAITVIDDNKCQDTTTAIVPLDSNLVLTMGPGATICQGISTTLSTSSNAASFTWTPANGLNNATTADPVADPATTTAYSVTAALGVCTKTGTETVTILPAPVPDAGPSDTICPGKSTQLEGSGGVGYEWSPATYLSDPFVSNPIVQQPATSITYSLTILGTNGCTSVQPGTTQVVLTPPPLVFAGDDTAVLAGQPLPLNAVDVNNVGFSEYAWTPASGLNNPAVQNPVAQITGNITYTVTATTADGCMGTGSITIDAATYSDIIVPNAFTPNNDGHNDVLRVDAIGIRDFKYFSVFNRWGQEVFTTSNQGIGWDGTRGGQVQPGGAYVWAAMGLDFSGKQVLRKGTVILIR